MLRVTEYFGQKYHCWKDKGHGIVNMKKAIKESCDIYFYEVARLLGVDRLHETAMRFGLGQYVVGKFIEEKRVFFQIQSGKKVYWSAMVPRRNYNCRYRTRLVYKQRLYSLVK